MTNETSDQKCKNRFYVQNFIGRKGQRFSLLFDRASGAFPLIYPCAYTTQVISSLAANTQMGHLYAIKKLLEWEADEGISIEYQLASNEGFTPNQINRMVEKFERSTVIDGAFINHKSFNTLLDVNSGYLVFLHGKVTANPNSRKNKQFISELKTSILSRKKKVGSRASYEQKVIEKKLSEPAREALLDKFLTPSPEATTPFQQGIEFRNTLCFRTLYDCGIRVGELLSLKLKNFKPATGGDHAYLEIERNQDDEYDKRVNQPVVKTEGRIIAITPDLEQAFLEYIGKWRADIENVSFDDESFIFVIHKNCQSQGQGIKITSFRSTLTEIIMTDKRLIGLHPHLLRHDWNYRFSQECKRLNKPAEKEREEREYLMGWAPGSGMAKIYDRRHIQEEANKLGLAISSSADKRKKS